MDILNEKFNIETSSLKCQMDNGYDVLKADGVWQVPTKYFSKLQRTILFNVLIQKGLALHYDDKVNKAILF